MIVPNSQIARQKLTNFSAPQRHYRAQVQITLNHSLDAVSAKDILVTAAKRSTLILSEPAPDARALAYNAEGIVYAVRYWVPSRSEEHTSELQSLMRISYAVFCLKKKNEKAALNKRS